MYIDIKHADTSELTPDLIQELRKLGGNGIKLIDLLRKEPSCELGLWINAVYGFDYGADLYNEEQELYNTILHNIHSKQLFSSCYVNNSSYVSNSANVTDSYHIQDSNNITNSSTVLLSNYVQESQRVFTSKRVTNSKYVVESDNVVNSTMVTHSSYIQNSANIMKSNIVLNSRDLRFCTNMNNTYSCAFCSGLTNALFCSNLKQGNYLLFNEPVAEFAYKMVLEEYMSYLPNELGLIKNLDQNTLTLMKPDTNFDYRCYYLPLLKSQQFVSWVKSLPNFSSDKFYNLTQCNII